MILAKAEIFLLLPDDANFIFDSTPIEPDILLLLITGTSRKISGVLQIILNY